MTVGDLIDKLKDLDWMLHVNVVVWMPDGGVEGDLTDIEDYPDEVNLCGRGIT